MSDAFKSADEAEGALQAAIQENYTGVRVVRAFGREKYEMEKFDEKNDGYVAKVIKVSEGMSFFWSVGDAIAGLQLMLVIAFGVYRCVSGGMTVGTFTTFYSYTSMMIWPIRQLGRIITSMSKATVSANRIHEVLRVEPENMDEVNENMNLPFSSIEFRNVKFSYRDGESVLKNVSFDVGKGQTLGILGETGSGKSTIAYLLTRLYDLAEEGSEILIDGVNINNIPKSVLRSHISLVLQEPFLYSKTIKENITAPDLSVGEEELYQLAEIADIHDAVMKFTERYDTIVGERGVTLSGDRNRGLRLPGC
ncbi:atp-binding cassette sub-family b [Holotrichia oblita]|nr:atp-binding cassette sub-family b [Holotrichia oblita]